MNRKQRWHWFRIGFISAFDFTGRFLLRQFRR